MDIVCIHPRSKRVVGSSRVNNDANQLEDDIAGFLVNPAIEENASKNYFHAKRCIDLTTDNG